MIKVRLDHDLAKEPIRAHINEDAGLDVFSVENKVIPARGFVEVNIGIAVEVPQGYEVAIRPRSGLGRIGIQIHPGTIDMGYRDTLSVVMYNHSPVDYNICAGDKVAQLIIRKVEMWNPVVVKELSLSARNNKGFGSTGR